MSLDANFFKINDDKKGYKELNNCDRQIDLFMIKQLYEKINKEDFPLIKVDQDDYYENAIESYYITRPSFEKHLIETGRDKIDFETIQTKMKKFLLNVDCFYREELDVPQYRLLKKIVKKFIPDGAVFYYEL